MLHTFEFKVMAAIKLVSEVTPLIEILNMYIMHVLCSCV